MPTGYTAAIKDGITFKQYALNCARAFGALIMMRDDPADEPIPERFEPTSYHTDALATASDRLTGLRVMSPAEAGEEAQKAFREDLKRFREAISERTELRNKYNAMLAQVVQWEPPTPDHVKYKDFMLSQIHESIEFDCSTRYYEDHPPVQHSGATWLAQEIERAERDIAYHTKHHAEEIERTEGRNAWVKALRESLP